MHHLECIIMIHSMHLKLEKTFHVFFNFFFIFEESVACGCVHQFFLLNMNTLISSLTHFSYWLDYVFMQKNTLMKFEEEFSLFE